MLLFSSILDINKKMTKDAFLNLVIKWNQNSPHTENVIPDLNWNGERNIRFGDASRWMEFQEYRNKNIIAVRYEKTEADDTVWDTDYVMNFSTMKLSVRLDRSYLEDAFLIDAKFSTPYFITMLINEGYLERDGSLTVDWHPHLIDESSLPLLAGIITEKSRYRLPVVYVSRSAEGELPLDIEELAYRLKGTAHVLVLKDVQQTEALTALCDEKNDKDGSIGLFFPNQSVSNRHFTYRDVEGGNALMLDQVVRQVIQFINFQQTSPLYTWSGVINAMLMDRLSAQREERINAEKAKLKAEEEKLALETSLSEEERRIRQEALSEAHQEANDLIASFDNEMDKLKEMVDRLSKENEALLAENQGLRGRASQTSSAPLLFFGNEMDYYPGEIKDLLLSILTDTLLNLPENSRRKHIVTDVLEANDYQKTSEIRAAAIRNMLKNYSRMDAKTRQALESAGFVISDEGKHYKLKYHDDGRYTAVFAKTPSDVRSGKNNASDLIKLVY